MIFEKLYSLVEEDIQNFHSSFEIKTQYIHSSLIKNQQIRDILEIESPIVEDISSIIEVEKGKVLAVRMDQMYGVTGFKKPIIASLILKRLIEAVRRKEYNKKWIDGGNVNSCLALAYYAKKFEGSAAYAMSRFFPQYVLDYIRNISQDSIHLIKAPNLSLGIERDFYKYLVQLTRTDERYKTFQPLWHAKYSGGYSTFLGDELANKLNFCPDYIVAVLGAGSTIEGQAIPIKTKFKNKPQIIVPEHSESPLLHSNDQGISVLNKIVGEKKYPSNWFSNPPTGIPHYVIGPHYDEINPLIKEHVLKSIECVYRYDDDDWKQMSFKCYNNGIKIGNSSAANLVVAKDLAIKGKTVLTFIYEPFRDFYHRNNISTGDQITELNNPSDKNPKTDIHT